MYVRLVKAQRVNHESEALCWLQDDFPETFSSAEVILNRRRLILLQYLMYIFSESDSIGDMFERK